MSWFDDDDDSFVFHVWCLLCTAFFFRRIVLAVVDHNDSDGDVLLYSIMRMISFSSAEGRC